MKPVFLSGEQFSSADGRHNRRVFPASAAAQAIHRGRMYKEVHRRQQQQTSSNRTENGVTCVRFTGRRLSIDCCRVLTLQLDPPAYRAGLNTVSKKVNRVSRVRIKAETMFSYIDL